MTFFKEKIINVRVVAGKKQKGYQPVLVVSKKLAHQCKHCLNRRLDRARSWTSLIDLCRWNQPESLIEMKAIDLVVQ